MFTTEWKFGMMDFDEARAIRRAVFAEEMDMPEDAGFDWEDGIAAHLLVRLADGRAVATARIYPDGDDVRIGPFAVLPDFRRQGYGDVCLRLLLFKAQQLSGSRILADVPEKYVPYYERFGFQTAGGKENGVQPMRLNREDIRFPSECGNHH